MIILYYKLKKLKKSSSGNIEDNYMKNIKELNKLSVDTENKFIQDRNPNEFPIIIEPVNPIVSKMKENEVANKIENFNLVSLFDDSYDGFNYCFIDKKKFNASEKVLIMQICKHTFHESCFNKYIEANPHNCPECSNASVNSIGNNSLPILK